MAFFQKKHTPVNLRTGGATASGGNSVVVLLLLVIAVVLCVLLAKEFNLLSFFRSVPVETEKLELLDRVARHVVLPDDEKPNIATVTDPVVLQGQDFFKRAEKGDRVIVYPNAQRAILYRPGIDRIVEMMPFDVQVNDAIGNSGL